MRQDRIKNPRASKQVARSQYKARQMDKFIKWSVEGKGKLKWSDLVSQQDYLNIKVL